MLIKYVIVGVGGLVLIVVIMGVINMAAYYVATEFLKIGK